MVPGQTISPTTRVKRAARIAAILYAVCCAVVLPIGLATTVVGAIHLFTATLQPKGHKTAPFRQGNTLLYNTPQLLAWHHRLLLTSVAGTAVLLTNGGVLFLLQRASDRSTRQETREG